MPSYYTPALPDSPLLEAEGAKRRSKQDADLIAPTGVTTVDPYKGNWAAETTRSQAQRLGNMPTALEGLGRQVLGDQTGADAAYKRFLEGEQRATELGPQVQTFDDASKNGGGIGDYASAIGYQAAQFLPDIAMAATGAGVGAGVAKGVARRAAVTAVKDVVENRAANVAAREVAVQAATRRAALAAPDGARAVSDAMRVARAQTTDAAREASLAEAARIAGRTPRIQRNIALAEKVGGTAGGAAGFYPSTVGASVPFLQEHKGQAAAAKVGSVDALAALVGSLPFGKAFEALAPEAKAAAKKALQEDTTRFLPRLLKDTTAHAAGGGTAGAAMTATQLAGHKWVDNNVDLLDANAMGQYLDSFVGGAVAGGAFGAGGVIKSRAGRALRNGVGNVRDMVRGALSDYADKARALVAKGREGQVVEDGDTTGPTLLQRLRGAAESVRGTAQAGMQNVASRFRQHESDLQGEHAIDEATDRLASHFEGGAPEAIPGKLRAANQNPITGLGGLRDHLMSYVDANSPVWMDKSTARYAADSLERLVTGKRLTAKDLKVHEALTESGALKPEALDAMKVAGKQWGSHLEQLAAHEDAKPADFSGDGDVGHGAMAEQLRAALDAAHRTDLLGQHEPHDGVEHAVDATGHAAPEGELVNGSLNEGSRSAVEDGASHAERFANARVAGLRAGELLRAAKGQPHEAEAQAAYDAAKAHYDQAKQALVRHVYGEPTANQPYGKNVIYQSSKDATVFEGKLAEPGRVEIDPVDIGRTKPLMARRALSLDTLAAQELGQNSDKYNAGVNADGTPYTEPQKFKAALMSAFADALQAGVKIKPESITAGEIKNRHGEHLATLTPADVRAMRAAVKDGKMVIDRQPSPQGKRAVEKIAAAEGARQRTDAHERERDANAKDRPEQLQGVNELDNPDLHKLAPREMPTGRAINENGRTIYVPDEGVRDVSLNAWAGEAAHYARERAARGETGPNGEDPRFVAGVEIGKKLLERELEATGNERRYQNDLKRLQDPASGKAMKIYYDAGKGKFDSARVTEKKADHEKIDKAAQRQERLDYAETPAMESGPLNRGAEVNKGTGRLNDDAPPVPKKPSAETRKRIAEQNPSEVKQPAKRAIEEGVQWEQDVGAAAKETGPHDHKAELRMLNGILDRLGIKTKIAEVRPLVQKKGEQHGGAYSRGRLIIEINDNLHGPERVEVLLHELGHHVVWDAIAKTLGVEHTSLTSADPLAALKAAAEKDPELFGALRADYNQWAAENNRANLRAIDVRNSRAPFFRGAAMLQRMLDSRRMGELSPQGQRYMLDAHEWLADNVARALAGKHESQSIIGKFFNKIADALRSMYDKILGDKTLARYAPAKSVDKWIQSLFDANAEAIRNATGATVPSKAVEPVIRAAVADGLRRGRGYDPSKDPEAFTPESVESFGAFVKYALPADARAILDRVMQRPASIKVLRTLYKDNPAALKALDDAHAGMENRIMLGYMAWKGGKFQVGSEGRQAFFNLRDDLAAVMGTAAEGDLAHRIFSDIANGSVQRYADANKKYDVRELEARARGNLQRSLNWVSTKVTANEAMSKFWNSSMGRARNSGVPALASFAAHIVRPQGTTSEHGTDQGMTPAIVHTLARYERDVRTALDGLTHRQQVTVLDALQRQLTEDHPAWAKKSPTVQKTVLAVRKLMDHSFEYMKNAGLDVGYRENFFPVVFDLRNESTKQQLFDLYNQPKFEGAIREALGHRDEDGNWVSNEDTPFEELVQNLVDGATSESGLASTTGSDAPNFRGMNHRLSQFVYEHGGEQDIRTFAKMQSKDAADVFARYLGPMVKRAEYTRRFGAKGEKKEAMFAEMRKQGASEAQINEADNMLKAALGTYGAEGSPTLAALSPALSKKLSGQRVRDVVVGAQAYQNARLLPLSLLSSLVDPMGIAVRTGGDFKSAWTGFRSGMNALFDKANKAELHKMLEDLGAANDTLFVLQSGFGGGKEGLAGKVNQFVFRYNGMEKWVLNTRYQALEAAHAFLLKHAEGNANEHSLRYLQELGLKPGDVRSEPQIRPDGSKINRVGLLSEAERKAAPKAAIEQDDRVRNALRTFVDDAILRPNSTQRPLWHNDPYMGLITQYKAFGYAMYDQIMGRFWREMKHGNMGVMNAALGYVPVVLAAELTREFLQYGSSGNPDRTDWGPTEYLSLATRRTGLLGPKYDLVSSVRGDVQRKHFPGSSLAGPSVQQADNLVDAFEGRRDLGKEAEGALPASALYQHWDDSGNDNGAVEAQSNG